MRTRGFLKRSAPEARTHQLKLQKMTALELAWAAENPDHSEAGRAAAATQLKTRADAPDRFELVVPGFVKPASRERLFRRFFGPSRAVRKWSGLVTLLSFIAMFIAVGVAVESENAAFKQAYEAGLITFEEYTERERALTRDEIAAAPPEQLETFVSDTRLSDILMDEIAPTPAGQRRILAERIGYGIITLMVLSCLLWITTSALRRQPARVLLLRKFNDKKLAKTMERVIMDELRPFGHIVTLSDKHIKRARLGWVRHLIPTNFLHVALIIIILPYRLIRRQFNRSSHGAAYVGSARDLRNFARRLRQRIGLNIEMATTAKEAIIVRSSDAWWQPLIRMLMASADVIVVDLSNVTSGTEWELDRLAHFGLFEQAVLMARHDRSDAARQVIAHYPAAAGQPLWLYDTMGDMDDRDGFREAMLGAIYRKQS